MMNSINPQFLKMLMNGNPQQMALQMLQQKMGNNPILQNIMGCVNNGQYNQIETIARNICKSKGIDPDAMYKDIAQKIK